MGKAQLLICLTNDETTDVEVRTVMVIVWSSRARRLSDNMKLKRKRKAAKLATLRIKKIFRDERRNSARFKKELKKLEAAFLPADSPKLSKGQTATQQTEVAPKQKDAGEVRPVEKKKKANKKLKAPNKKTSIKKVKTGKGKPAAKKRKKLPKKVKAAKVKTKKKAVNKKRKGANPPKRANRNLAVKDVGQVVKVLNPNSTKGRPIKAAVSVNCTKCQKPIFHSFFSRARDVCECRGVKKATFGAFWQTSAPSDDQIKTTAIYRVDDRTLCSRTRTERGKASRVNMVLTMEHGSFIFGPNTKSSN